MYINKTPVFIGTSGYNYDDWKGTFAPEDTANFDLLNFYIKAGFNFLELTYTFYRLPIAEKIIGIAERCGENVKLSVRLTKTLMRRKPDEAELKAFKEGIQPLIETGRLAAIFADFHHLFGASRENFEIIAALKEQFSDVPFFVELTNSTWHKVRFYEEFRNNDIGLCVVDGPSFKGFAPYYPICTNNNVYFRLYGKNPMWINPSDRFLDYSYSTAELARFAKDATSVSVMAKNIFFSFCNVENGKAPKNAAALMDLISK